MVTSASVVVTVSFTRAQQRLMAHLCLYNLKMAATNLYQESTDSTITYLDYCEVPYPLFEDPTPLPFYDTPMIHPLMKEFHRTIEIKRRILEYCAKY